MNVIYQISKYGNLVLISNEKFHNDWNPFYEIEGLIFDCDGLLVDSEPISGNALRELFKKNFKVNIGTDYSSVIGKSGKDGIKYYLNKFQLDFSKKTISSLLQEKQLIYQNLAQNRLKPFLGVIEFLEILKTKPFRLAVASSGSIEKINFSLLETRLNNYFSIITSTTEVENGKPSPDLFLKAAEKLGCTPRKCLVFEDSIIGVEAAKKANMNVIAVTNTFSKEKLLEIKSDVVVASFKELIPQLLSI